MPDPEDERREVDPGRPVVEPLTRVFCERHGEYPGVSSLLLGEDMDLDPEATRPCDVCGDGWKLSERKRGYLKALSDVECAFIAPPSELREALPYLNDDDKGTLVADYLRARILAEAPAPEASDGE